MPLPIIIDRVSYSSLSNWEYCSWFYKLVDIEKLRPPTSHIWSAYGTLVHKYLQGVLGDTISAEDAATKFEKTWNRFCRFYKKEILKLPLKVNPLDFVIPSKKAILSVKEDFQKVFGNYRVIRIEELLTLRASDKWEQQFKGYIDLVIELENGNQVIVDFKTCDSSYYFNKYKDKFKEYQLTLYKHFFCLKHSIHPDNVETYFVTIERNPQSKKPLDFFKISSGDIKVKNALEWLQRALASINNGRWFKNRLSCHKYSKPGIDEKNTCVFYNTPRCPGA